MSMLKNRLIQFMCVCMCGYTSSLNLLVGSIRLLIEHKVIYINTRLYFIEWDEVNSKEY